MKKPIIIGIVIAVVCGLIVVCIAIAVISLSFFSVGGLKQNLPEQVACTMEAKLCPDGVTYVGRTGPRCEFQACPEVKEEEPVFCTLEVKLCPDGVTYVGRTGPKCEFEVCP